MNEDRLAGIEAAIREIATFLSMNEAREQGNYENGAFMRHADMVYKQITQHLKP